MIRIQPAQFKDLRERSGSLCCSSGLSVARLARHFPVIRLQVAIVTKRTARFKRNDLSCRDSCLLSRRAGMSVPVLMPSGQRFRSVSAQRQPGPHSNDQSRRAGTRSRWSLTLYQRRRMAWVPVPTRREDLPVRSAGGSGSVPKAPTRAHVVNARPRSRVWPGILASG